MARLRCEAAPGTSATGSDPSRRAGPPPRVGCETCAIFRTGTEFLPILTGSAMTPAITARPTAPPCSTGSSSAPKPNGADHHARHHTRSRRRGRIVEMLTFLAGDYQGASNRTSRAASPPAWLPAYNIDTLCADLHRFAFLLASPTAKNSSANRHHDHRLNVRSPGLARITRRTPNRRGCQLGILTLPARPYRLVPCRAGRARTAVISCVGENQRACRMVTFRLLARWNVAVCAAGPRAFLRRLGRPRLRLAGRWRVRA